MIAFVLCSETLDSEKIDWIKNNIKIFKKCIGGRVVTRFASTQRRSQVSLENYIC